MKKKINLILIFLVVIQIAYTYIKYDDYIANELSAYLPAIIILCIIIALYYKWKTSIILYSIIFIVISGLNFELIKALKNSETYIMDTVLPSESQWNENISIDELKNYKPKIDYEKTTEIYPNGKPKIKTGYLKNGLSKIKVSETRFYNNGQVEHQMYFKDDKVHGLIKGYHPNGQLASENYLKYGGRFGPEKTWYENSQIQEYRKVNNNNVLEEIFKWYPNGDTQGHVIFSENKIALIRNWHQNGVLERLVNTKDNTEIRWDESGETISIKKFKK